MNVKTIRWVIFPTHFINIDKSYYLYSFTNQRMEEAIGLLLLLIFSGLLSIASFIFIIVIYIQKKIISRIAILSLICFLFIAVFSGGYLAVKAVKKTKDVVADVGKEAADNFVGALAEHLSGRHPESLFLDSIKSIQPENKNIPAPYFYCAGFRDYYRTPLIYPYSLIAIDDQTSGTIEDESKVDNVFVSNEGSKQLMHRITNFWFDRNILVAKATVSWDQDSIHYITLQFTTKELKTFATKEEADNYLIKQGMDTTYQMTTPLTYYRRF